jgi:hypothetical protein
MPKKFPCPLCPKVLTRSTVLTDHLRAHNSIKPFQCQHKGCERAFTRRPDLLQHRKLHGPGEFLCRTTDEHGVTYGCSHLFHRERDLDRHRQRAGGTKCRPPQSPSDQDSVALVDTTEPAEAEDITAPPIPLLPVRRSLPTYDPSVSTSETRGTISRRSNAKNEARFLQMLQWGFRHCVSSCNFKYDETVIELVQHYRERHSLSVNAELEENLLQALEKGAVWNFPKQYSADHLEWKRHIEEMWIRDDTIHLPLKDTINVLASFGSWHMNDVVRERWLGEQLQLQVEFNDNPTTEGSLKTFKAPFRYVAGFDNVDCVDNVFVVRLRMDGRIPLISPTVFATRLMNITKGMLSVMRKQDEAVKTLSQPAIQGSPSTKVLKTPYTNQSAAKTQEQPISEATTQSPVERPSYPSPQSMLAEDYRGARGLLTFSRDILYET